MLGRSDDKEGLSRYLDLFHPANASMVGAPSPSPTQAYSNVAHTHFRMLTQPSFVCVCVSVCEQVTGEATPSYFGGWSASERIARLIPRVKVIVMLRHPVDRFYSE